jgi:hypothetical protein
MKDPLLAEFIRDLDRIPGYPLEVGQAIHRRVHKDNEVQDALGYEVVRRLKPWITRRRNAGQAPTPKQIDAKYDELRARFLLA